MLSESAKGILSSTMKEEIEELVKESLSEQEDMRDIEGDDMNPDMEGGDFDSDMEDDGMDSDMEDDGMDSDMEDGDFDSDMEDGDMDFGVSDDNEIEFDTDEDEDDVLDMRGSSENELLKVFKAMGDEDGIIISKEGSDISLADDDNEYLIRLGEQISKSDMDEEMDEEYGDMDEELDEEYGDMDEEYEEMDEDAQSEIDKIFETDEEVMYEISMDDEGIEDDDMDPDMEGGDMGYEGDEEEEDDFNGLKSDLDNMGGMEDAEDDFNVGKYFKENPGSTIDDMRNKLRDKNESYDYLGEAKKGPKFKYKMPTKGFDEKKKEGPKKVGTGKPKFQYDKNAENVDGKMKKVTGDRKETKEASRTYAMGSKIGRGLRKGVTPNRNLTLEGLKTQVISLQEKNNEYKKSLNVFREKLNEVAVFNSNLAYATRLFTEHSTTKKEKINILRRFDDVQSLQESKNLYGVIRGELSKSIEPTINESVSRKITNVASTGSSANLIESKTYENPQFLRMKDLISKLG
ncbi:MAG: hypothetical protein K9I82_04215 [Chitinophagaceae bacterium]|nr:hypothetical protein [Chitinophagaceae bacterium]